MTDKLQGIRDILPKRDILTCHDSDRASASHLDLTMAAYLALVASLSRAHKGQSSAHDRPDQNDNLSQWVR